MPSSETIILQTKQWIIDVVVGCNFCPFASREVKNDAIHYQVMTKAGKKDVLEAMALLFEKLNDTPAIETALLILPAGFSSFTVYLDMVDLTEQLLDGESYGADYQVASFHPAYIFSGSNNDDAANYTNRSPYPMLHILREASVTKAIEQHKDVDNIPQTNIDYAQKKGLDYMRSLREASISAFL